MPLRSTRDDKCFDNLQSISNQRKFCHPVGDIAFAMTEERGLLFLHE